MGDGAEPGQRLDAAYAGGDPRLLGDEERRRFRRCADMGAAAQLRAELAIADRHHPDLVAILFAEERHRARRDRLLRVADRSIHGAFLQDLVVDELLDGRALLRRQRGEVHEVEAQAVGRDQRAGLLDVRA